MMTFIERVKEQEILIKFSLSFFSWPAKSEDYKKKENIEKLDN